MWLIHNYQSKLFLNDSQEALDKLEQRLPKGKLNILCGVESVTSYLKKCDYCLYQALVDVLVPDVLRPIPCKYIFTIFSVDILTFLTHLL